MHLNADHCYLLIFSLNNLQELVLHKGFFVKFFRYKGLQIHSSVSHEAGHGFVIYGFSLNYNVSWTNINEICFTIPLFLLFDPFLAFCEIIHMS